jgi:3-dehydroquinate dehydratase-2
MSGRERPGVVGGQGTNGRGAERGWPLVVVLSGPNLALLGEREPEMYGTKRLADHLAAARLAARRLGLRVEHHQCDDEGELVALVHAARGRADALVVNAGALTHYSWALSDALGCFDGPVVEVHLSNPAAREPWRHRSVVAPRAAGTIAGFGGLGYRLAMHAVAALLEPSRASEGTRARTASLGSTTRRAGRGVQG